MHLFGKSVLQKQEVEAAGRNSQPAGNRLRAVAALMLALTTAMPSGFAQQAAATAPDKAASELPSAPAPAQTEPLDLRQSKRDFSIPSGRLLGNPIKAYMPTSIDQDQLSEFRAPERSGEEWQDLSQPERRAGAGAGE